VIRRAMVLCTDGLVTAVHLMFDDWSAADTAVPQAANWAPTPAAVVEAVVEAETPTAVAAAAGAAAAGSAGNLHHAVRINEHQLIMATIAASPSRNEAAKRLGISPRTLRYKLAQLKTRGLPVAVS